MCVRYILPTVITLMCSSALYAVMKYFSSRKIQKVPKIPEKLWNENITNTIKPCNIIFFPELIEDLKTRLKNTRKDLNKSDINDVMQELLNYWANSYNFQNRQKYINKYPHFITNIQGLDIHYIHVKPKDVPKEKQILPLLMLHGWPNSIMEFFKIIPLLITPKSKYNFVFEVIVPSLPGFGFSSAPPISGFSCVHLSVILKNLMLRLGHNKFCIQGGDWGIFISRIMSTLFPEHVLGTHCNVCALLDKHEKVPSYSVLAKINKQVMLSNKLLTETKYFQIQAMKPETIGVALNNSPAALASYIIEKFLIATNYSEINKEFLKKYSYDDLIDNLMIYWISKSITTAMRVYAEQFTDSKSEPVEELLNSTEVKVLNSFSYVLNKASVLKGRLKNVIDVIYIERNGRFPAIEEPELFAEDIYSKIDKMNIRKQA